MGCVFMQTTVDEQGYPVRDETSTSYVGAIESCKPFGRRPYAEAWQRGQARADNTVSSEMKVCVDHVEGNPVAPTLGAPIRRIRAMRIPWGWGNG